MTKFSASEAKLRFGELLDAVQDEPVEIVRHGQPVAVVVSTIEFDRLKHIQETMRARQVSQEKRLSALQRLENRSKQPQVKISADLIKKDPRIAHLVEKNLAT